MKSLKKKKKVYKMLGYGNIILETGNFRSSRTDEVLMRFKDESYLEEIADVIKKPVVNFGGDYEHHGTLRFGQGFIFTNFADAMSAARKIDIVVYSKHRNERD